MPEKIILAGGTGFLGKSLASYLTSLDREYEVVIFTRGSSRDDGKIRYVHWDGTNIGEWAKEIEGSTAIVNFTGKSVNCIYTKKNRSEIIRSRIDSVDVLTQAILTCEHPPKVFIQAGSLAIFGNTQNISDEEAPHGQGFSVNVCEQWEKAFFEKELPDTRKVLFRIGFALGQDGGALEPLIRLVKNHLGGTVGSGKQYISWIHIDDLNKMFLTAIETDTMHGIYNATGPTPVRNREFMKILRNVMRKGWAPPTPTPFVWLGGYFIMRTEPSLALTGRNCIPKRLLDEGFVFQYTDLTTAFGDLLQIESAL